MREFIIDITTGLQENSISAVCVYPNPADKHVILETGIKGLKQLSVFNLNGQLMDSFLIDSKKFIMSCQGYKPGIYMLLLHSGKKVIAKKLVIK